MKNGLKIYLNEVFKKIQTMPFDPNSAKKAGKKSKRGPAKKEGPSFKEKMEILYLSIDWNHDIKSILSFKDLELISFKKLKSPF